MVLKFTGIIFFIIPTCFSTHTSIYIVLKFDGIFCSHLVHIFKSTHTDLHFISTKSKRRIPPEAPSIPAKRFGQSFTVDRRQLPRIVLADVRLLLVQSTRLQFHGLRKLNNKDSPLYRRDGNRASRGSERFQWALRNDDPAQGGKGHPRELECGSKKMK